MLTDLIKRLDEQELKIAVPDDVEDWLAEKGYDNEFGERPIKRLIQKEVENKLALNLLKGEIKNSSTVYLSVYNDELVFY